MVEAMEVLRAELAHVQKARPWDAYGFYIFLAGRLLRWARQVHTHKPPRPEQGDAEEVAASG
jgi:hypothetical protein